MWWGMMGMMELAVAGLDIREVQVKTLQQVTEAPYTYALPLH